MINALSSAIVMIVSRFINLPIGHFKDKIVQIVDLLCFYNTRDGLHFGAGYTPGKFLVQPARS